MSTSEDVVVRPARVDDVDAVCAFGEAHVPPHYTPLIGADAARQQVTDWWRPEQIRAAVTAGQLLVAVAHDRIVGVAQHAREGVDVVIYKLYVDPSRRGQGLGPRLIEAVVASLPPDVARLLIEHFAGNARAGAFYEREGFAVERVDRSATGRPELDVVWRARVVPGRAGAGSVADV
ncbi:GNAT superfamily N-acetyltransferase [Nocardioides zeae]|uniref:GNAT superfamily N-acetyltransferase n=1 Tax=Nocardioides zeae TaxID=1457234 RepID=A0ACC6IMU1_9ACTN|nr:GNAT family N-acetyltransferase [Nocardioides zeae]MDR6176022.1 GNAT superfamily N-acetyltransferase [Nocardioides zeae]MDR6212072.1 GNAT superfamily N-acetyltransferase [Nocardioides zeae]